MEYEKKKIYITNNDHHKLLMVSTKYDINAVHSCLNHFRFRWWTKDHDKWQRMCTLHDFLNVNCRFRFYIIIRNGGYNLQIEIMHDHIYGDHDDVFFLFHFHIRSKYTIVIWYAFFVFIVIANITWSMIMIDKNYTTVKKSKNYSFSNVYRIVKLKNPNI